MKLRIRGNSLRMRVTRSEVELIRNHQAVQEVTCFGPRSEVSDQLIYCLESSSAVEKIEATFQNQKIRVMIPEAMAQQWVSSPQVTLCFEQKVADGQILKILIEKDFFCLKPRTHPEFEDQADFFSHPNSEVGTCG